MGTEASGRHTERIILRGHAMTVDDGYEGGAKRRRRCGGLRSMRTRKCESVREAMG